MTKNAKYFIKKLNMLQHPEGGFYSRSFVSDVTLKPFSVNEKQNKERKLWTSIYFLLKEDEVSNFHRLTADEMWYFHSGNSLTIYVIDQKGNLSTQKLGLDIENGEMPQVLVPRGSIFGSAMNNEGFSLVGCMVSPGFEFEDFELFKRQELLNEFPQHKLIINKLTKE
ncbi:cupin domain-containing protein [Mycoplasma todarodis]|uniref:cupin domain-containing protein n=1 Tax=Mycoplasma todarodis TaxID=1937191 RepID=UPI003B2E6E34